MRSTEEHSSHRQAAQELAALFAKVPITLNADAIPAGRPPEGRLLTQDASLNLELARTLLGKELQSSGLGGGTLLYTGVDGGTVQFRTNGAFDAVGPFQNDLDPDAFCRAFCRAFDFEALTFSADGTSASARQTYDGYPVSGASVTFSIQDSRVISVSGTCLPDSYTDVYTPADGTQPITALTALTTFLDARRQIGAVVSAVTDVRSCYELQSSSSSPMTLVPAWCITTDIGEFYVNALTCSVTYKQAS